MKLTRLRLRGASPTILVSVLFCAPIAWWSIVFWANISPSTSDYALAWSALKNSHILALTASLASVLISLPLALSEPFLRSTARYALWTVVLGPVCVGMLPRNFAWQAMLSSRDIGPSFGWATGGLGQRILYTDYAVVLVMSFVFLPLSFFVLSLATGIIKPIHLEAARVSGASSWAIARHIYLPVLLQSSIVAFFLVYCSSLGYFLTPAMLGSNRRSFAGTLITKLMNLNDFGFASTVALLLLLSSVPFVGVFLWLATRRRSVLSWKG